MATYALNAKTREYTIYDGRRNVVGHAVKTKTGFRFQAWEVEANTTTTYRTMRDLLEAVDGDELPPAPKAAPAFVVKWDPSSFPDMIAKYPNDPRWRDCHRIFGAGPFPLGLAREIDGKIQFERTNVSGETLTWPKTKTYESLDEMTVELTQLYDQGSEKDKILLELTGIEGDLSPENLTCDGELRPGQIRVRQQRLLFRKAELEKKLGYTPTDEELADFWRKHNP